MVFAPNQDSTGYYNIDVYVNDLGTLGKGGPKTNSNKIGHVTIKIDNVNDPPYAITLPTTLPGTEIFHQIAFPPSPCTQIGYIPMCSGKPCPGSEETNYCKTVGQILEDSQFTFPANSFKFGDVDFNDWMKVRLAVTNGLIYLPNCCSGGIFEIN